MNRLTSRKFILFGIIISLSILVCHSFFYSDQNEKVLYFETGYLISFICGALLSFFERQNLTNNRKISKKEILFGNIFGDCWISILPSIILSIIFLGVFDSIWFVVTINFIGSLICLFLVIKDMLQYNADESIIPGSNGNKN